jgi:hypothetical protein
MAITIPITATMDHHQKLVIEVVALAISMTCSSVEVCCSALLWAILSIRSPKRETLNVRNRKSVNETQNPATPENSANPIAFFVGCLWVRSIWRSYRRICHGTSVVFVHANHSGSLKKNRRYEAMSTYVRKPFDGNFCMPILRLHFPSGHRLCFE